MNRIFVLALFGAAALCGCNFAPKYVRSAEAVPARLPHDGIYPAAASDAPDVTQIGWHDFFIDDRLRQVIDMGLANNRDLRVAAANVLAARARYRIQRSEQLPTIETNSTATYSNDPSQVPGGNATHIYRVDAGFSAFELDLFGRLKNLTRAALQEYFATDEAQRSTRVTLISEIANAWLTLGSDEDQLQISLSTMNSFKSTFDLTQARFRIGTASELEMRQADTDYQSARNDVAVLQTQIAQDRNALELLVGAPVPDKLLPRTLPINATLTQLPAGLSSTVLLRRPDVLSAEHQLIAQHANIGAARAALFPTVSLTGLIGAVGGPLLNPLFAGGSFYRVLEPNAGYDIFNYGRSRANVRLAEADQKAALANYEKTLQTAFREVADALAQRGTIGEQLSAQTASAKSAEIAARLSDARYRVGVGEFLDYLIAQRTAYRQQQSLVNTRLSRELNLIELYRSLGGGLS